MAFAKQKTEGVHRQRNALPCGLCGERCFPLKLPQSHLRCARADCQASATELTEENFSRSLPGETFSRTIINKIFDELNVLIGDRTEIETLRKEKTNNIIGVFIRYSLPGFVRLSKENEGLQVLFQQTEIGEFRTIVKTDAFYW